MKGGYEGESEHATVHDQRCLLTKVKATATATIVTPTITPITVSAECNAAHLAAKADAGVAAAPAARVALVTRSNGAGNGSREDGK